MRIFSWRYDNPRSYILYNIFMITSISILFYISIFILSFSNISKTIAVYKPYNETYYKIYYTVEEQIYLKYCNYDTFDDYKIIMNKNDVLLYSDKAFCNSDITTLFYKLIIISYGLIIFLPLTILLFYDFNQFWKIEKNK